MLQIHCNRVGTCLSGVYRGVLWRWRLRLVLGVFWSGGLLGGGLCRGSRLLFGGW